MSKRKYKVTFVDQWLEGDVFKSWLQKVEDIYSAQCSICKMFGISKMEESELKIHMKGKKHCELEPTISRSQNSNFSKSESTDLSAPFETQIIIICLLIVLVVSVILLSVFFLVVSVRLLDSMMVRTSVAHADICWALMIVLSNYSKSSCDYIGQLFKVMSLDNKVAESFS